MTDKPIKDFKSVSDYMKALPSRDKMVIVDDLNRALTGRNQFTRAMRKAALAELQARAECSK